MDVSVNMTQQVIYRAVYPYELARAAGVSRRTMSKWIAAHQTELQKLGYTHDVRILPPSAVKFLCEFYCITLSDI